MPQDRGICCHVGGQIDFDYAGNLYLSTGDDTNPFFSAGYTPIDDRATRNPAFDARRTAGNTNDLRGKMLRIRVRDDGSYAIPAGNLFGRNQARTRPEIYAMGLRNPFRFAVNRRTGDVYVGDYSPDANMADPARGPAGQGRWMLVRRPANYGWPFCATPDKPYVDFDFTPSAPQSGEEFNCFRPTNDSAHNTGLRHAAAGGVAGGVVQLPGRRRGPVPGAAQHAWRGRDRADGRPGVRVRQREPLAVPVPARVRRPPAVLRVDARLLQGVRAKPSQRRPAGGHGASVRRPGER